MSLPIKTSITNFLTASGGAALAWSYSQPATSLGTIAAIGIGAISATAAFKLSQTAYQRFYPKAPSTYQISVNLMCAAQKKDRSGFQKELHAIFNSFSADFDAPSEQIAEKLKNKRAFNSWMCGRILLASALIGDEATAKKILPVMEELLKEKGEDLPSHVWGLGYLAIYYAKTNPENFEPIKTLLIERTDELASVPEEKLKDNVHWVVVMNLQSLALANDIEAYKEQIKKLIEFTGTSSLSEALMKIPTQDMRAWSIKLALSAAEKIGDDDLHRIEELKKALPKALETSPENDKMLTQTLPSFCNF